MYVRSGSGEKNTCEKITVEIMIRNTIAFRAAGQRFKNEKRKFRGGVKSREPEISEIPFKSEPDPYSFIFSYSHI